MRTFLTRSLLRGVLAASVGGSAAAAAIELAGCSSGGDSGHPTGSAASLGAPTEDAVGSVKMQLTLQGGQTINIVSWTVTGPNGASTVVQTGTTDVSNSTIVSFLVGGIPAGNGYTISLMGSSTDGTAICAGVATFNTMARTTTDVSVALQCTTAPSEAGSALVNASTYGCASVSFVTASPAETTVGHSVALSGTATGPTPAALTYAWSASSGSFDTPSAASANFTCTTPGPVSVTLTASDGPVIDGGAACNPALATETVTIQCDTAGGSDAGADATVSDSGSGTDGAASDSAASDAGSTPQSLFTTLGPDAGPAVATINLGTAIGAGSVNGGTPPMLSDLAADTANSQTIIQDGGAFFASGNVPDPASVLCRYDGGVSTRITHVTGSSFETSQTDPMTPLTPAYFPLVYNSAVTTSDHGFGGQPPIVGLFDWRPKDLDEGVLVAESDDNGKTWYFMQNVLELNPDYTNPLSGGNNLTADAGNGCPPAVNDTNANTNYPLANNSQDDDGWGHAAIIQLPGVGNSATGGQLLYLLDRNTNNIPGTSTEIVDGNPLWVVQLAPTGANGGPSQKFPIWNTNSTVAGHNDIKSISSTLSQTPDSGTPISLRQTVGLTDPDGIMAVFPTAATAEAGTTVTVLWVQKILNGDNSGSTALPTAEQCTKAPFSGKTNHDIATVRLATTTDGVNFIDLGPVNGLSDPTTVDYNKTRWVSPRGTLIDIFGNGTRWGLYFSAGNCLDGDSDAFHYIGYAESSDKVNWTVYNDINHPIASINPITTTNQATGQTVTIPANPPLIPTQPWFAERLYAPTGTQIDPNHLSLTFAGYGVQTPNNDLLEYRQIGNVVLTINVTEPDGGTGGLVLGTPNNINAH